MRSASSRAIARPRPDPARRRRCRRARRRGAGRRGGCRARRRETIRRARAVPLLDAHRDARALGRVDDRIVDEDTKDLGHPLGVAVDLELLLGQAHVERRPVLGERRRELLRDRARAARRGRPARAAAPASRPRAWRGRAARWRGWSAGRSGSGSAPGTRRGCRRRGPRPPAAPGSRPARRSGVRSSCEAVAMKRLRAVSRRASWLCMSLNARASWPSSSTESTGTRAEKSPGRDLLGRLLEALDAQADGPRRQVAGEQGDGQRDRARDEDLAADQMDVGLHVGERRREDQDVGDLAVEAQRPRRLAQAPVVGGLGARDDVGARAGRRRRPGTGGR